jgi:dihydrofolate synthase/folylpolyglutamate synthase
MQQNLKLSRWQDFEQYLDKLGLFRMQPGLDRIETVLSALGLKRPPFFVAQGVGTNAKGSCCTFLASLAQSHGLLCGLHTSPHFLSVRERIRLFKPTATAGPYSGELFPESAWLEAARAILESGGDRLTYFELVTVIAAFLFRQAKVDVAVMETGLGGSFDATTALEADLVFFTPIALDHCDVLGSSLRDIARDKAGAIRAKTPAISAVQNLEVREVKEELEKAAVKQGAPLDFCPGLSVLPQELLPSAIPALKGEKCADNSAGPKIPLAMRGRHQLDNAALSLFTWRNIRALPRPVPANPISSDAAQVAEAEIRGLAQAWIPGRLQFIAPIQVSQIGQGSLPHPPVILDGGHNPHALASLGHSLALLGIAPPVTIFSCLQDKQPEKLVPHLRVLAPGLILTLQIADNPRAMEAEALARLIGPQAKAVSTMTEAILIANEEFAERLPEALSMDVNKCGYPLLICGSLYLLAEFYRLYPQYLYPPTVGPAQK